MKLVTVEQTAQPTAENWPHFAQCGPGTVVGGVVIDPDIFYPESRATDEGKLQSETARLVCLGCSAINFCFQARVNQRDKAGVRGGMTETEYIAMVRKEDLKDNDRQVSFEEAARLRATYAHPMSRLQRDNLVARIERKQKKQAEQQQAA